jgi:DNA-binding HxlR family transcriptional regulator
MGSDDLFEAVSHPMRIEIVKVLAEKPLRFADLKRHLKIDSSGLLDFHLKKLNDLITTNDEGNYTLTERGFAALQAVETTSKYYWLRAAHKRSYILAVIVSILLNVYILWIVSHLKDYTLWFGVILPATVAWMLFYSYWTFIKRRIRFRK